MLFMGFLVLVLQLQSALNNCVTHRQTDAREKDRHRSKNSQIIFRTSQKVKKKKKTGVINFFEYNIFFLMNKDYRRKKKY